MAIPLVITNEDAIRRARAILVRYEDINDLSYFDVAGLLDICYRRVSRALLPYVPQAFEVVASLQNGDALGEDFVKVVRCVIERDGYRMPARFVHINEWQAANDSVASSVMQLLHGKFYQPAYLIWGGYDTFAGAGTAPPTFSSTSVDITVARVGSPRIYFSPSEGTAHLTYLGIPQSIVFANRWQPTNQAAVPIVHEFGELVVQELVKELMLAIGVDANALDAYMYQLQQGYSSVIAMLTARNEHYTDPVIGEIIPVEMPRNDRNANVQ
jgi:hypothetical protein